jgi:hypothetical protein
VTEREGNPKFVEDLLAEREGWEREKQKRAKERAAGPGRPGPGPLAWPEETKAIRDFSCPTCKARPGERCKGEQTHKRRLSKVPPMSQTEVRSVRTVSGGAIESKRRRH